MSVSIIKEIFLATGESFTPTSLNATPDHELIVTATWGRTGLASKVNLNGEVKWNYRWSLNPLTQSPIAPVIAGATVFPSGNILLCGNETFAETSSEDREARIKGRLIKLNAKGELIEEIGLLPPAPFDFHFFGLRNCGRWGDGTYVIGYGVRVLPNSGDAGKLHRNKSEHYFWIVRTDANGKIIWEKVIPTDIYIAPRLPLPQILPNGNLLVAGKGGDAKSPSFNSTDLIVLSPDGEIHSRRNIPGSYIPARRTATTMPIVLFPVSNHPASPAQTLDIDESLRTIGQRQVDKFRGVLAYQRGQSQLVKFGFSDVMGRTYRGMASIDLTTGAVDEQALPGRGEDRYEIDDVTALDQDNQFAFTTIRVNPSFPGTHSAIGITILELK